MRILRPILYLLFILIGAFILFLIYARVEDYRPEEQVSVWEDDRAPSLPDSISLNLLSWNIGYAGLDASMDFFYDGGKQMRPSEEGVKRNIEGIVETLTPYRGYDFILLQEVDKDSKRSYHYNEFGTIEGQFNLYKTFFGMNYKVPFVPIPLKEPMGKVESGLMTLSWHTPSSVVRYGFPGNYAWPKNLFMLDRCFLVNRYPLSDGHELLVINTHNSAYDDGSLREKQMTYLKGFLLEEYRKDNFVIVGGDWNQSPNGLTPELPGFRFDTENLTYVEKDYPAPDWIWAYDPATPTNRRVAVPYERAHSLTTIIDYYLLSPNIHLIDVKTAEVDFKYSDHQPVKLKVTLVPEHAN